MRSGWIKHWDDERFITSYDGDSIPWSSTSLESINSVSLDHYGWHYTIRGRLFTSRPFWQSSDYVASVGGESRRLLRRIEMQIADRDKYIYQTEQMVGTIRHITCLVTKTEFPGHQSLVTLSASDREKWVVLEVLETQPEKFKIYISDRRL